MPFDFPRLGRGDLPTDTLAAARRLLGCIVVRSTPQGVLSGRIVETEAYLPDDPASHSWGGPSARNASMFLEAGRAYVYLIYGFHHCLNVVTDEPGTGAAVLVRALEPLAGHAQMAARRGRSEGLLNGPGKLCQAMAIDRTLDGEDLTTSDRLYLLAAPPLASARIVASPRIGITKAADRPWRFVEADSPHLSRPLRAQNRS